jgi:hypothetical protein
MPLRVTISPRSLDAGGVELKRRSGEPFVVTREHALGAIREELGLLAAELEASLRHRMEPVEQLISATLGDPS